MDGCEKPALAGSNLCLTAINEELDCIDVATVVAGEEHYSLCDLIEFADSAKRSAAGRAVRKLSYLFISQTQGVLVAW